MAWFRNINKLCNSGNFHPWYIKETLKAAGWTVSRSGSGTSGYFDTSDVFNTCVRGGLIVVGGNVGIGIGLEALGNRNCWFVMRSPNRVGTPTNREIIFIRIGTVGDSWDSYWSVGYSRGGLYTGGSAAVSATATDEVLLYGARPPGTEVFQVGNAANVIHVCANSSSINDEFGFLSYELVNPNTTKCAIIFDPLTSCAAADVHPMSVGVSPSGAYTTCKIWVGSTQCDVSYRNIASWSTIAKQDEDGYERPWPYVITASGIGGYKGLSTFLNASSVAHTYPNTANNEAILYVSNFAIKNLWDGVSVPTSV